MIPGVSHGGVDTLAEARQSDREKGLPAWDIFHGNLRVELTQDSADIEIDDFEVLFQPN